MDLQLRQKTNSKSGLYLSKNLFFCEGVRTMFSFLKNRPMHYCHHMVESCIVNKLIINNNIWSFFCMHVRQPLWPKGAKLKVFLEH